MDSRSDSTPNENQAADQALTIKGLCARLQIDQSTYHRHRASMPAPIRIGSALRFPIAAVEAWEAEQVRHEQVRRLDRAH